MLRENPIAVYVLSNVNKHIARSSSTRKRKRWCILLSKLFFIFFVWRTPKQKRTSTFADFFSDMQNKQSTKCRKTGCQAISFAICFNFRKYNTYTKSVYVHHFHLGISFKVLMECKYAWLILLHIKTWYLFKYSIFC